MLSERKRMKHVEYELAFTIIGGEDDGCGFGFPCTKDGTLIHNEYYDCWIENYKICVAHPEKFEPVGRLEKMIMVKMTKEMQKCFNEMSDEQKIRMFYELTKYMHENMEYGADDEMNNLIEDIANVRNDIDNL